ncbi:MULTISPECIES: hypothetical protein [unclassified Micromonospora]|uniref:restriction system modified-DNA reader domain-containing protein n=1 Tax=Micromonospora TaxID=1873 RepID=UPI0014076278|nr:MULTISPECIES: hypothetical protein [unclassified Micromonospora]NHO85141.1 hypothetical protein [Micromonospora sp. CMU55-4]WBB88151.1 hypothetical protein O7542_13660 [Micromonospora sp. WMMC264]
MRRIEIDDEVYAELERNVKGFEQPNDVLRRLLLEKGHSRAAVSGMPNAAAPSIPGALTALIEKGLVQAGDTLSHVQVRKGRRFAAIIEADGWIRTDLGRYKEPSPALGKLTGTSIDGWAYWVHDTTKQSLRQLRAKSGGSGRGGH